VFAPDVCTYVRRDRGPVWALYSRPWEQDLACAYAGKDIDCPIGGCIGFSFTMPSGFVAQDQTTNDKLLAPRLGGDTNWSIFPGGRVAQTRGELRGCDAQPRFLSGYA